MPIYLKLRSALQRSGWVPVPFNRCVLVSVMDPVDCEKIEPLLSSLRGERLSMLFIPGSNGAKKALIERYGEAAVVDPPWNNRLSSLVFLLTSRARLLIGIDGLASLPRSLLKEAYVLGIGIAVIAASMPDAQGPGADMRAFVDLWLPLATRIGNALRASGIPRDRIASEPMNDLSSLTTRSGAMRRLNSLMARRPPARSPLQTLVTKRFDNRTWRSILALRAERIETLDELGSALHHPQTILCLGNGPSSEDPALGQYKYDCMFRVNHRWLKRGLHCDPQMVFTAQKRTLFTIRSKPIFAFQTRRAEAHLVTHQIFNPLCRRMRFVTLERTGILGELDWDGVRPTNGATMLATAVALQPARIIIAGIDLFEDPAGAYPDDDKTPNDYVIVHERAIEMDFILKTLRSYRGELVILSKPLAERWAATKVTGMKDELIG